MEKENKIKIKKSLMWLGLLFVCAVIIALANEYYKSSTKSSTKAWQRVDTVQKKELDTK